MALVAPSILAADWGRLNQEVQSVEAAGADWHHLDVMDGSFVPPISFGADFVAAIKKVATKPLDVHLMIVSPEKHIDAFAKAGAACITVHAEVSPHLHRTVQRIHELGCKAGVALNPATSLHAIDEVADDIDLLLIMTVNPGWGGQPFIARSEQKIRSAHELLSHSKKKVLLEVDGGIKGSTASRCVAAGAEVLVAGTHVFGSKDYAAAIAQLRDKA